MTRSFKAIFIPGVCLLFINAVEEVVGYKLTRFIRDPYMLTCVLMIMYAAGFTLVASLMIPGTKKTVHKLHNTSRKKGGFAGVVLFYAVLAFVLFKAYYVIYTQGPQYLLPRAWR